MRRAIKHIEANLFRPLSLAEVADAAGLSVYHLHRLFTAVFGHSIKTYVRKRRLSEAAVLLRTTDRGVLEIALDCQFESQAAFTRAFHALFGAPPARYRRATSRAWYPGVPPATAASLEHLRHDGVTRDATPVRLGREVTVCGLARPIDLDAELRILEQWAELLAAVDAAAAGDAVAYGVALPGHPDVALGSGESLVYLAGIDEASPAPFRSDPPHRCTIPPGDYVAFEHRGAPEQMAATIDYIWATWLPRSGLAKSRRPDFERFRVSAFASGQAAVEIWISVDR